MYFKANCGRPPSTFKASKSEYTKRNTNRFHSTVAFDDEDEDDDDDVEDDDDGDDAPLVISPHLRLLW